MRARHTRRRVLQTASMGSVGVLLTGCGSGQLISRVQEPTPASVPAAATQDFSALFAQYEPADEPNGDLTRVEWPQWLLELDPEVKQLYEFQILNGPLMRFMPCFCGCQSEDGHRNNRDCYVDTVHPDGSVVLDSMAPT